MGYLYFHVHCSIIYNSQNTKSIEKCPSADEDNVVETRNTIRPLKRTKFCHMGQHGWILEDIMPNTISQAQKDKHIT